MPQHIVTSPDGVKHIITAPEGATPDEVMAYARKTIPMQQPVNKSVPAAPIQQSTEAARPNFSVVENAIHGAATIVSGASELAAKMVGSLPTNYPPAPTVGQAANKVIAPVVQAASNIPVGGKYETLGGAISGGMEQAETDYPRLTRLGKDALVLAPTGIGAMQAKQGIKAVGVNIAKNKAENIAAERAALTKNTKVKSGASYEAVKAQNIQFNRDEITDFQRQLQSLKPKDDVNIKDWKRSDAGRHVDDIVESITRQEPSFNGLLEKRKKINSDIKKLYRNHDDDGARKLEQVREALDKTMIPADTGKWREANHLWSQQAIMDDMDEIVSTALGRVGQPANSLDTAINAYMRKNARTLTNEEYAALKEVTQKTHVTELAKAGASGLMKYAAAAHGGVPGFLIAHYGSELTKNTMMGLKVNKLDKFYDLVRNRPLPQPVKKAATQTNQTVSKSRAFDPSKLKKVIPETENPLQSENPFTKGKAK